MIYRIWLDGACIDAYCIQELLNVFAFEAPMARSVRVRALLEAA